MMRVSLAYEVRPFGLLVNSNPDIEQEVVPTHISAAVNRLILGLGLGSGLGLKHHGASFNQMQRQQPVAPVSPQQSSPYHSPLTPYPLPNHNHNPSPYNMRQTGQSNQP